MSILKPIILVEDDLVDAITVKRAFKQIGVKNEVIHCQNGEDALAVLKTSPQLAPTLILLDLNMPRMGGIEFLEAFQTDERSGDIPIVILTTSTESQDRMKTFQYQVAGYMIKPVDYHDFVDMMRSLSHYLVTEE